MTILSELQVIQAEADKVPEGDDDYKRGYLHGYLDALEQAIEIAELEEEE